MKSWLESVDFFQTTKYQEMQIFLKEQRNSGKKILPEEDDVFNALKFTPLDKVKVVILGQDPYPNPQHAHGLAFSIPKTTLDIPKSLQNILKELDSDLGIQSTNGNLEQWAREGVLLLNTVLTVEQGNSNSHKSIGWKKLTTEIIKNVNSKCPHVVFILWGRQAQTYSKYIDESKHLIITSPHPSPLSSYRGFFGSKPFSRTNAFLLHHKIDPINWEL